MKIVLTQPFTVGDLAPGENFSDVYITTIYINGPARSATVTYEVGTLGEASQTDPMGTWVKAPYIPAATMVLNGAELFALFAAPVRTDSEASPYLWDQVEASAYAMIQAHDERMAGEIT